MSKPRMDNTQTLYVIFEYLNWRELKKIKTTNNIIRKIAHKVQYYRDKHTLSFTKSTNKYLTLKNVFRRCDGCEYPIGRPELRSNHIKECRHNDCDSLIHGKCVKTTQCPFPSRTHHFYCKDHLISICDGCSKVSCRNRTHIEFLKKETTQCASCDRTLCKECFYDNEAYHGGIKKHCYDCTLTYKQSLVYELNLRQYIQQYGHTNH
jgi:hypothetical protein